jgi:multicomponent Na+:H+ antiporter subunit B
VIETLVDIILLAFLAITAIAINRIRNLFAVIMLFGIFSLLSAGLFVILDAADVAFTEAAVGAGISTVLMLATLALTKDHEEKVPTHRPWLPLVVVFVTGGALIYGTIGIPAACRASLYQRGYERYRSAQPGDRRAGQLSRIRHPR